MILIIFSVLFLCVTYTYTWVHVPMRTCLDMWRPEAGVKYLALPLSTMCFETRSLPEPVAHPLAWLVSLKRYSSHLPSSRIRHKSGIFVVIVVLNTGYWGSRLRSSHLHSKNFTP